MAAEVNGEDTSEGRLESTIQLRIVEAKNLPASHELRHTRDAYVIVALDQEEIFRTATAEKTLNPFFSEEYNFHVPRDYRQLCFYVCDHDIFGLVRETRLGKVAISKVDLVAGAVTEEKWYPILPIDPDSEVQGKIQLGIGIVEKLVERDITQHVLCIRVIECSGLSAWGASGFSDPYCLVALLGSQGLKYISEAKRSLVKRKTVDPQFSETFEFSLDDIRRLNDIIVRVSVWHQALISEDVFLGQVNISVGSLDIAKAHLGWHLLTPRHESEKKLEKNSLRPDLGSIRLRIVYSLACIFPLKIYEPLKSLLLRSLESQNVTDSVLYMLYEVHKDRAAVGRTLVKIFLQLNKLEELAHKLIEHEVNTTTDPNTLFRGNSLASKVIDEFMKVMGQSYLQKTLGACIDEIFEARKSCEIDVAKLPEGENRDVNMANLLYFVEKIISAISSSGRSCPQLMCKVFAMLKEAAVSKFPDKEDVVQYTAVSGFIFLRFFAPAILSPKLFQLRPEFPTPVVARTLTLISKCVQNIGNFGGKLSSGSSSLMHKESFMSPLNMQLMDLNHIKDVKKYLTAISDPRGGEECPLDDMVYREGFLIKRSQGRKRGPKNFRRRYFCLTEKHLLYAKSKTDPPLCVIPSQRLLAVERVDDDAFGMKFMFQLVQPERILYMQAKNSVDLMEWLSALAKACSHSSGQLDLYHSGAYVNNAWTCCGDQVEDLQRGCKPISLAVKMLGYREDMGLERELHKVYKMFLEGQANLMKLKDEATSVARDRTDGEHGDALPLRIGTICELLVFVKNLEITSSSHLTSRMARLGSKNAPYSCPSGEALVL